MFILIDILLPFSDFLYKAMGQFELGKGDSWKSAALLHSTPGTYPTGHFQKKSLQRQKTALQRLRWACCFALYSTLRTLNSTITTAKAVPDLHICSDPKRHIVKPPTRIKFCKYKVSSICLERPHLFLISAQTVCSTISYTGLPANCDQRRKWISRYIKKMGILRSNQCRFCTWSHDHISVELPELTKISL